MNALTFRYESIIEENEVIDDLGYDLHLVGTGKDGEIHQTCVEYEVASHFAGKGPYEKDTSEWMERTALEEYSESC